MFQNQKVTAEIRQREGRIVFCGHFELFERPLDWQQQSVNKAKEQPSARLAILVGDIGAGDKILAFYRGGIEAVAKIYAVRIECASSCQIEQLPNLASVKERIDAERLEHAVQILKARMVELSFESDFEAFVRSPKGASIIHKEIVAEEINIRCRLLGLTKGLVEIYQERTLRNLASKRMSTKRAANAASWIPTLEDTYLKHILRKNNGTPTCRSILLALYDLLEQKGYKEVIQIYSTPYSRAISNGSSAVLHMKILTRPQQGVVETRWDLRIRNIFIPDTQDTLPSPSLFPPLPPSSLLPSSRHLLLTLTQLNHTCSTNQNHMCF